MRTSSNSKGIVIIIQHWYMCETTVKYIAYVDMFNWCTMYIQDLAFECVSLRLLLLLSCSIPRRAQDLNDLSRMGSVNAALYY